MGPLLADQLRDQTGGVVGFNGPLLHGAQARQRFKNTGAQFPNPKKKRQDDRTSEDFQRLCPCLSLSLSLSLSRILFLSGMSIIPLCSSVWNITCVSAAAAAAAPPPPWPSPSVKHEGVGLEKEGEGNCFVVATSEGMGSEEVEERAGGGGGGE